MGSPASVSSDDSVLGTGSYACVVGDEDPDYGSVALKVSQRDPSETSITYAELREMTVFKTLPPHPNVMQCFDIRYDETDDATPPLVFVLPRYDRGNMKQAWCKGSQTKRSRRAWYALHDLAHALHHVHRHGFMHRDLKLENVLIDDDDRAILADFGLSRFDLETRRVTTRMSPPRIRAPEVNTNHYTPACDVYSLACIVTQVRGTGMWTIRARGAAKKETKSDWLLGLHDYSTQWRNYVSRCPPRDDADADLLGMLYTMLEPDPVKRTTIQYLLSWLRDHFEEDRGGGLVQTPLGSPTSSCASSPCSTTPSAGFDVQIHRESRIPSAWKEDVPILIKGGRMHIPPLLWMVHGDTAWRMMAWLLDTQPGTRPTRLVSWHASALFKRMYQHDALWVLESSRQCVVVLLACLTLVDKCISVDAIPVRAWITFLHVDDVTHHDIDDAERRVLDTAGHRLYSPDVVEWTPPPLLSVGGKRGRYAAATLRPRKRARCS